MKKVILFLAMVIIGMTPAAAAEQALELESKDLRITKRYRYTQPIMFVERGVEFLIFPNGEFDFNTELSYGPVSDDYYYRQSNGRRSSINRTIGAPGMRFRYGRHGGTLILHDRFGKVRRIGNVFINYDRYGRVKRVGSVYMRYRRGLLKQVGGLTLQYNRFGDLIGTHGLVNFSNQNCGICGMSGCTADHFHNDWDNDHWEDDHWDNYDDDFYYYRNKDGKMKKRKKKKKRSKKWDD
ncbi:MAG: hypothetical protein HKM99_06695 [Flavobacteriaceae bacterium]|nr:hypothetical protein [Flavobacteriaceae bacterium]